MRTAALLLILFAAPLFASDNAEVDYAALVDAFKAKDWAKAVDLAEAFVKDHADFKHAHAAMYMGGNAGMNGDVFARGEALFRLLLEKHPDSKYVEKARNELVTLLSDARKLEDCIKQCEANLKAVPDYAGRDVWVYRAAECRFRLWQFKDAETALTAFLKDYPDSKLKTRAEGNLAMINPPLKVGAGGVAEGYAGKYVNDVRFARALKALPGYVDEAWKVLRETLGVDLAGKSTVVFEFKDKGYTRESERALTETIAIDYKPVTRMTFYTEHIVVSLDDFKSRVTHELKHAAFRGVMGQAYLDLPKWIREGLAVYGAKQTDDRIRAVLGNEVFGNHDPRRVLDGVDDANHDMTDYIEDAMAFAWLEGRRKGAVHEFCRRLLAGEPYQKLFAELSGMEYAAALKAAADAIKADINKKLGPAEAELLSLQAEQSKAVGAKREGPWAKEGGIAKYEAWLKANAGHVLEDNARYKLGRALVAAARYDDARKQFGAVAAQEIRCALTDDARYWIARSFELEGKEDEARAAFGVLLRDYCWSSYGIESKDKYKEAGPVKE